MSFSVGQRPFQSRNAYNLEQEDQVDSFPANGGTKENVENEMPNLSKIINVIGYSASLHSNILSYIIFRIKNAVLSIFGQSDWQQARNEVTKIINRAIRENLPVDLGIDMSFAADGLLSVGVDLINIAGSFANKVQSKYALGEAKNVNLLARIGSLVPKLTQKYVDGEMGRTNVLSLSDRLRTEFASGLDLDQNQLLNGITEEARARGVSVEEIMQDEDVVNNITLKAMVSVLITGFDKTLKAIEEEIDPQDANEARVDDNVLANQ